MSFPPLPPVIIFDMLKCFGRYATNNNQIVLKTKRRQRVVIGWQLVNTFRHYISRFQQRLHIQSRKTIVSATADFKQLVGYMYNYFENSRKTQKKKVFDLTSFFMTSLKLLIEHPSNVQTNQFFIILTLPQFTL